MVFYTLSINSFRVFFCCLFQTKFNTLRSWLRWWLLRLLCRRSLAVDIGVLFFRDVFFLLAFSTPFFFYFCLCFSSTYDPAQSPLQSLPQHDFARHPSSCRISLISIFYFSQRSFGPSPFVSERDPIKETLCLLSSTCSLSFRPGPPAKPCFVPLSFSTSIRSISLSHHPGSSKDSASFSPFAMSINFRSFPVFEHSILSFHLLLERQSEVLGRSSC